MCADLARYEPAQAANADAMRREAPIGDEVT